MEQATFTALILTDQGVDDIQRDPIGESGKTIDIRHGRGETLGIGFKASGVIDAAHGQAVEISRNSGLIMIEQRSDVDDLSDFPGHEVRQE